MSARSAPRPDTVYLILIGNELLSGKVVDTNGARAIPALRAHGLDVIGIEVVPDETDRIVASIRRGRDELRAEFVVTSGGIGPTHDDITMQAVAEALERPLARNESFADQIRGHFGERCTEAALSMADLPVGTELVYEDSFFPLIWVDNVYVLPGDPEFFERKLKILLDRRPRAAAFASARLYTRQEEAALAALLRAAQDAHPEVGIGSYPRRDEISDQWVTMITLDAKNRDRVLEVLAELRAKLPAEREVRVDWP